MSHESHESGARLYVSNFPYATEDGELRQLFAPHGEVGEVKIMVDRETGRSRGFGFVAMGSRAQAEQAIAALHDQEFRGRRLTVGFAKERPSGTSDRRDADDRRRGGRSERSRRDRDRTE